MNPGILKDRVTVQHPTRTVDSVSGERRPGWGGHEDDVTVWAQVKPLTAREQIRSGQSEVNATHVVTIRYLPGLTEDCRLLFGERVLNITGVINVGERNAEMQILAAEQRS